MTSEPLSVVRSIRLSPFERAIVAALAVDTNRKEGQVIQQAITLGLAQMRERPRVRLSPFDRDAVIAACVEILTTSAGNTVGSSPPSQADGAGFSRETP